MVPHLVILFATARRFLLYRQVVAPKSSLHVTILVWTRGCVKRVPGRMGDGWGYRGGPLGQLKRVSMYGVLGGGAAHDRTCPRWTNMAPYCCVPAQSANAACMVGEVDRRCLLYQVLTIVSAKHDTMHAWVTKHCMLSSSHTAYI